MTRILVAFGGNLGDRELRLRKGLERLRATPGWQFLGASSLWQTEPVGGPPQDHYLNACATFRTESSPRGVLDRLLEVEDLEGRMRSSRDAPRTLDLDLLLHGSAVVEEDGLEVPHPRLAERAFVLVPAAEVAADWLHPVLKADLYTLEQQLRPIAGVVRHGPPESWS